VTQAACRPELVDRALAIFREWNFRAPTGAGGLTRKDMRLLERAGYVEGKITRLPSGSEVNVWTWKGPR